ncbi:hypothetical protein GCM10010169_48810 [Micromonospora fulviviridis]|uniref:hypothetical protein n=1 Tax=Micromonospora fulviviridis TaxID=47860 RepID=UPI001668208C|nr:hypothetical protein [Micromonospora fulviviridis]GGR98456.1 hypothetical protein GCM10010169_48810 [Micromonospora fulviviridis]
MPVPHSLRERFRDPAFWQTFFFDADGATRVPNATVELSVGGDCQLVLEVQGRYDCYELGIRTPTSDGVRSIGWDDMAHWHPFALRWWELDLICRAASALDPLMPHPGPTLVLLCRFVSVQDDDDIQQITSTMHTAFESLRPAGWVGYWPNVTDWLARRDFRGRGVSWTRDQSGNLYAVQDEDSDYPFYSMRGEPTDDPAGFPYEEWRSLLVAAGNTLGV